MSDKKTYLGEFEEIVLLAVLRSGDNAYGVRIRQEVEEAAERSTSIGAIYATLDRLEQKGFVKTWQGEATPERGGRAKRYFEITGAGMRVLKETLRVRRKMLSGLDIVWSSARGAL